MEERAEILVAFGEPDQQHPLDVEQGAPGQELQALPAVEVAGDANDPFADAVLLSVALKFRTQANLHFITQDRALAKDLQRIIGFESVRPRGGQTMVISRVTSSGRVEPFADLSRAESRGASAASDCPSKVTSLAAEPVPKPWWERIGRIKS